MGKQHNALKSLFLGLSLTGAVYGQQAKIDQTIVPIKKELTENIQNNKVTIEEDQETETIISFMSNMDNGKMKSVLKKYGYTTSIIDTLKQEEPDSILYESIRKLNKRYGNPKITAKWSRIFNGKNYRGQFSPKWMKNKIDINPKIYNDKLQMLVIRLAELSHAKQYEGKGMTKRILKDLITLIDDDFKYKKMYNKKGTIEDDAHKEIEPELYLELVELYLRRTDTTKTKDMKKTEILIEYLIQNMKADSMNPKAIQYMSKIKEVLNKDPNTINDIIKEIQKYIDELQNAQAIK